MKSWLGIASVYVACSYVAKKPYCTRNWQSAHPITECKHRRQCFVCWAPPAGLPPRAENHLVYVQVHSRKTTGKRGKKVAPGLRSSVWQPSNQGIRSTLRADSEKKDRSDRSPCLLRKFPCCLPMHLYRTWTRFERNKVQLHCV